MTKVKNINNIPKFKSADEEAKYWEEHDILDVWDDLEPVTVKVNKPRKRQISIRFNPDILDGVQRLAEEKGIPYQTLIHSWVVERLRAEREPVVINKRTITGQLLHSHK